MYRSLLAVTRSIKFEKYFSQELEITTKSYSQRCFNSVQILGRVGNTPRVYSQEDRRDLVFFNVVTNESSKTTLEDGSVITNHVPVWHSFVVKRPGFTDYVANNITKGSRVYCDGSLQNKKVKTENGDMATVASIVLHNIVIADDNSARLRAKKKEEEIEADV